MFQASGKSKWNTDSDKGNINEHITIEARKVCYEEAWMLFYEINKGRRSHPKNIKIKTQKKYLTKQFQHSN